MDTPTMQLSSQLKNGDSKDRILDSRPAEAKLRRLRMDGRAALGHEWMAPAQDGHVSHIVLRAKTPKSEGARRAPSPADDLAIKDAFQEERGTWEQRA